MRARYGVATWVLGKSEAGQTSRAKRATLLSIAVLALVTLATRAVWFGDPVADFDEQIYSLIGWRMTHGDLPFVDVWDRKPFGLFAIFAAAHWLLGPEPIAYQLVACLFAMGGAVLVYALARELVDRASATVAGALYLMLIAAYGSYSGQSEIFHAPMMLAMLWLVRDRNRPDAARRAALAMLVGGVALQVKYTVLPQCLFFGAYALYGEWRAG
ncbi:MAG: glycosyltransferase family 39 protein, partial [Croceibacterium sp.]